MGAPRTGQYSALTTFFFYRVGLLQVADAEQDRLLATVIGSDRIVLDLAQHELKHITEYQPFFSLLGPTKTSGMGP